MARFIRQGKEFIFSAYTSQFGKVEHEALNIDLYYIDDITQLVYINLNTYITSDIINQNLNTKFYKQDPEERKGARILTFIPSKYKHFSKEVILFFDKLRMVLWNNAQDMQIIRAEYGRARILPTYSPLEQFKLIYTNLTR